MNLKERENLSKLIKKNRGNLSQRAYARRIGVNYASIRNWEECIYAPNTEGLEKLAKGMGYSFGELMRKIEGNAEAESATLSVEKLERHIKNLDRESFIKIAQTVFTIMSSMAFEPSERSFKENSSNLVETK
jgi:transcriptional regulator with XRE-family HTH domain